MILTFSAVRRRSRELKMCDKKRPQKQERAGVTPTASLWSCGRQRANKKQTRTCINQPAARHDPVTRIIQKHGPEVKTDGKQAPHTLSREDGFHRGKPLGNLWFILCGELQCVRGPSFSKSSCTSCVQWNCMAKTDIHRNTKQEENS